MRPRTLVEKVWDDHVILDLGDGEQLLHVDRHWLNDNAYNAIDGLDRRALSVRNPELTFAVIDHLLDTRPGRTYATGSASAQEWAEGTREGCARHGITFIDIGDRRHGISHVISAELGATLPGTLLVCTDSHTCTNGAFGAYACGVGAFGGTQVLATQTMIARRPQTMRVRFTGSPGPGATPKDVVLALIGRFGATAALGHAVEFCGPVIDRMTIEERMTICNMGVEFGAATAMIAPDQTTFDYLEGRDYAPTGPSWDQAVAYWRTLPTDQDATFDRELTLDCADMEPQITWGTSPEQVVPIGGAVPDPSSFEDPGRRRAAERALQYMGLAPGDPLHGLPIQAAFIGSCTNARLDDLRAAAAVLRGRRVAPGVHATCVPGSASTKRAAEAEGLDRIFIEAGFTWGEAGCSLCMTAVVDGPAPGARIVSSTNRSSEGRQGPGVRAHLASPVTVAASAVAGQIVGARELTA
ncbi:MAG TPA: 3-isopropylmalate dehydratase large subunit [Solirubrobacteraceae bacterium]|nr:3-isopropylmalate dehydratase large subunit [Solirubrobacteraceae bacterium]